MGVDFYPCHGTCQGTYCDCGDYITCIVCGEGACVPCGQKWHFVDTNDAKTPMDQQRVCSTCQSVDIPDHDIFTALLQLYRQLPGANLTLTYDTLKHQLSENKESRYAQWKRQNRIETRSDDEYEDDDENSEDSNDEDSNDEGDDTELEDHAAPAKRHCAGQPETVDT